MVCLRLSCRRTFPCRCSPPRTPRQAWWPSSCASPEVCTCVLRISDPVTASSTIPSRLGLIHCVASRGQNSTPPGLWPMEKWPGSTPGDSVLVVPQEGMYDFGCPWLPQRGRDGVLYYNHGRPKGPSSSTDNRRWFKRACLVWLNFDTNRLKHSQNSPRTWNEIENRPKPFVFCDLCPRGGPPPSLGRRPAPQGAPGAITTGMRSTYTFPRAKRWKPRSAG